MSIGSQTQFDFGYVYCMHSHKKLGTYPHMLDSMILLKLILIPLTWNYPPQFEVVDANQKLLKFTYASLLSQ